MKWLQFGDVHLDTSTKENVLHALAQILDLARAEQPDVAIDTGDLSFKRGHLAPWVALALREFHCAIAEVCPVIIVAGNHDLSYADGVGTVAGALALSRDNERIDLFERPGVLRRGGFNQPNIACLPYPSRYMLQNVEPGLAPSEVNARAGELLARVLRGLAAEAGPGSLLVFHGSIAGSRTSSEMAMTTDCDVVIPEHEIPAEFEHVLAGHIHRHQQIGRAVYAGSPCPLNFGEDHEHGVVMWENGVPRFVELEPKHRLVTLDLGGALLLEEGLQVAESSVENARVRVKLTIGRGADAGRFIDVMRQQLTNLGAVEVRFQIEHAPEDRTVDLGDVRSDLGHDELLAAYAKRVPDAEPMLDDLRRTFAEVDARLTPEQRALEQFGEYRLLRIACRNWKSIEEADLDVEALGSLVVIEGENAVGKSNLIEIEPFALYGARGLPRGKQDLGSLVRNGEQEAWVEAEFRAAGEVWRVRRTIRLNSKGVGVGDLVLERFLGFDESSLLEGEWHPSNEGTAAETQRKTEAMVGPYDLYRSTRCAFQGDVDRLIDVTPAERKDVLQAALGTKAFEAREAIAKQMERAQAEAMNANTVRIGTLRLQVEQLGAAESEVRELDEAWDEAFDGRKMHETEVGRTRLAADTAKAEATAAEHARKARNEKNDALIATRARIADRVRQAADLVEAVANVPKVRHQLAALGILRVSIAGMEELEVAHRTLAADVNDARMAAEMAAKEHSGALNLNDSMIGRQAAERDAVEATGRHQRERITEKLERARQGAGRIDSAPFGDRCAPCALLSVAVADRDSVPGLEAELAAHTQRTNDDVVALGRTHEKARAEADERIQALRAKQVEAEHRAAATTEALKASTFDETALARLRRELRQINEPDLRRMEAAALAAEGRAGALAEERARLETEAAELEAALAALPVPADVDLIGPMAALHAAEKALAEARDAEAQAATALARAKGKLEMLLPSRAALAEAEKAAEAHGREASVLGVFCRAMSRDGIPALVLERALPSLEHHANRFLEGGDVSIEIEPIRELRTGEVKSEVNVQFRDRFGRHALPAASGFQRVAVGIALRAALARVQADACGLKVGHWIVDEGGFGAADEAHVLELQQTIRRVATEFSLVLFISHIPAIREIADHRILVAMNGSGGSRVETLR